MMYILIDCTNYAAIARHPEYRALAALAYIQHANIDTAIFHEAQEHSFVRFDIIQLQSILKSIGYEENLYEYEQLKNRVKELVAADCTRLVIDINPTIAEAQAQLIDYADDKPYKFNPNGPRPLSMREWPTEPQRNRSRLARPTSVQLKPTVVCSSPIVAPQRPSYSAPATPAAPMRTVARRAATSQPVQRPKGGATGKVWEIADELKETANGKELRRLIVEACKGAGINETTAGVQYSKWKKFNNL